MTDWDFFGAAATVGEADALATGSQAGGQQRSAAE